MIHIPTLIVLGATTTVVIAGTAAVFWWRFIRVQRLLVKFEENAWQETREKQMLAEFLHNLTKDLAGEAGRETLFPALVGAASKGAGARSACLFEIKPTGALHAVATSGIFPPLRALPKELSGDDTLRADLIGHAMSLNTYEDGETVLSEVVRKRKTVYLADAWKSPKIKGVDDSTLRVRSLIAVPVAYGETLYGVLAVANPEHESRFESGDVEYVKSIGAQGGVALHLQEMVQLRSEKARLDFDLSLASGVQKLLLPQSLPRHPQLDLHACYRPAKQVGGDLYDIIDLGDGRICILVADVSGKGVSASLVMAMAHAHLRHVLRGETSPAEVLRRLNAEMYGEIQRGMFITVACAILDPRANTLTLARAGHDIPLILTKTDSLSGPRFLHPEVEGMALGMVPPEVFDEIITEAVVPIAPGSVLVFYTDGLTEARNAEDEEFGADNLARAVLRASNCDAADLNRQILAALGEFTGGIPPHDDLTLVTVKCLGAAGE